MPPSRPSRPHRSGFTLLELLMVIVILGVLAAVVAPRIGASMGGGRLRVGARGVMQAARYARTMSLLHQLDIDLVLDLSPEHAKVRVEAAPLYGERADGGASGRIRLPSGEDDANPVSGTSPALSPGFDEESGQYGSAVSSAAQLAAQALAETVRTEIEAPGCTYAFLGYRDNAGGASTGKTEGEARIRFRSNGTCRPFAVRVSITDDDALYVSFDLLGSAAVDKDPPR
ncbi:MAG: pilus assembly FimT family protein [Kiritimatiellia bacterium]|jgi:prepilin-type N-terminal cleavage/methylation domain-containing protein